MVVLEGEMASVSPAREGFAVSPRFSRERKQELRGKANGEPEGSPFPITDPLFQSLIRFFNHESAFSGNNAKNRSLTVAALKHTALKHAARE